MHKPDADVAKDVDSKNTVRFILVSIKILKQYNVRLVIMNKLMLLKLIGGGRKLGANSRYASPTGQYGGIRQKTPLLIQTLGITALVVVVLCWQSLADRDDQLLQQETAQQAAKVRYQLHQGLQERIDALQRLDWESTFHKQPIPREGDGGTRRRGDGETRRWGDWQQIHPHYSSNLLTQHNWIDQAPLVSFADNRATLDIYIPIFQGQKPEIFLLTSACTQSLIEQIILPAEMAGYGMAIWDGAVEIYRQNPTRNPSQYVAEVALAFYGVDWRLQVWPLPEKIKQHRHTLPKTLLVIGAVAAIWLVLSGTKIQTYCYAKPTLIHPDGAIDSNIPLHNPTPGLMTIDEQQKAELIRINEKLRHEINARGQLEEALLESEAVLAGILDNADDAIISVNEAQNITLFNQGAEKIFGYKADEVLGKHIKIILPETLQEIYYQEARDTGEPGDGETGGGGDSEMWSASSDAIADVEADLRKGRRGDGETGSIVPSPLRGRWGREIFGRRHDGTQFPAEASVSLLQLGEKRIFTVILRDITERLTAEIALQESQTRLKLLNSIATSITSGMSVEQVISTTLQQISKYFPGLRVGYATINDIGYLKWLYSIEPAGMPSLKGLGMDLTAAPHLWQYLNHGVVNAVADLRKDSRLGAVAEVFTANGTRAFLHVSLPPHAVLEGLLCFHSPAVREWSHYEIYLLKDVADYLAVAINEARAQQERFEAKEELQRQSEANRAFSANLKQLHRLNTTNYQNLTSLFEDYLQTGCEIFHVSAGAIVQTNGISTESLHSAGLAPETARDNSESALTFAPQPSPTIIALKSEADWPPGWEAELNQDLIGQVLRTNKTVAFDNYSPGKHHQPDGSYWLSKNRKIKFYLATPIFVDSAVYGCLIFLSFHNVQGFLVKEYQHEIIEMMAQSIGKFIAANRHEIERQNNVKELEKNQKLIQKIADANPNILYIYDIEQGRNVYANREIAEIMGYTPEEVAKMGRNLFQNMLHPDDLAKLTERLEKFAVAKDGEIIETEYRMKDKNGEWHWLYSRDVVFSKTPDGKPKQVLGTATDITDRKRVEHQLQEANQKLTVWVKDLESHNREITLLGEMSDFLQACRRVEEACKAIATLIQPLFPDMGGAVFLINESNNLMEAVATWGNTSWGETVLAPHECWALRRGRLHSVDATESGLRCGHLERIQKLAGSLCVPMMAQGETLGLLMLVAPEPGQLTAGKKRLASMVAEHISLALANLKLRETLEHQSIRDPLTGLFNRRYMEEFLELELRRASRKHQSLGVVMMDVDYFKRFNDTFGHEAGDTLLRELGILLKNSLRGSDVACRYGGEELTLILPECSLADTLQRAEQIRQEIKAMQVLHRGELLGVVTVSLGVACFPEHGSTGDAVIRAADMALYRAKKEGRDRSILAPS